MIIMLVSTSALPHKDTFFGGGAHNINDRLVFPAATLAVNIRRVISTKQHAWKTFNLVLD